MKLITINYSIKYFVTSYSYIIKNTINYKLFQEFQN